MSAECSPKHVSDRLMSVHHSWRLSAPSARSPSRSPLPAPVSSPGLSTTTRTAGTSWAAGATTRALLGLVISTVRVSPPSDHRWAADSPAVAREPNLTYVTLMAACVGDGRTDYARLGGRYIHFFVSKGNVVHCASPLVLCPLPDPQLTPAADNDDDGYSSTIGTHAGDGQYWAPIYPFPSGWDFTHDENVWTSLKAIDLNGDKKMDIVRTVCMAHSDHPPPGGVVVAPSC